MRRIRVAVVASAGLLAAVPTGMYVAVAASGSYYRCDDVRVLAEVLARAKPGSELSYRPRTALESAPASQLGEELYLGDLADWVVVENNDRRVAIVRPHVQQIAPTTSGATWLDLAVAERTGPIGRAGRATWQTRPLELCVMHRELDLGGALVAPVALDAAQPARPSDTRIPVLVSDWSCAGLPAAPNRVRQIKVAYHEDSVGVVLGVEPAPAKSARTEDECASVQIPFVLTLDEPLGDRALVDDLYYPAVPLRAVTGS